MKFGVVASAQLAATGRLDAPFNLLMAEHQPLVEELVEKFDAAELVQLALALPFDQKAADAVFPQLHPQTWASFQEKVDPKPKIRRDAWGDVLPPEEPKPPGVRETIRWRTTLAIYCAAAAQFTQAKCLEKLLEIARLKLAETKKLVAVCKLVRAKGATHLQAAIARDSKGT